MSTRPSTVSRSITETPNQRTPARPGERKVSPGLAAACRDSARPAPRSDPQRDSHGRVTAMTMAVAPDDVRARQCREELPEQGAGAGPRVERFGAIEIGSGKERATYSASPPGIPAFLTRFEAPSYRRLGVDPAPRGIHPLATAGRGSRRRGGRRREARKDSPGASISGAGRRAGPGLGRGTGRGTRVCLPIGGVGRLLPGGQ